MKSKLLRYSRGTLATLTLTVLATRVGAGNQCLDNGSGCHFAYQDNGQCCVDCYWPCAPAWNNCIIDKWYCNPPKNGQYYIIESRRNCTDTGNTCTPN